MSSMIYARRGTRGTFAAKLARALGIPVVSDPQNLRLRTASVFNWGSSTNINVGTWIGNTPQAVGTISDKRRMFTALEGITAPGVNFLNNTTDRNEAQEWLDQGFTVYERAVVQGHSGEGIRIVKGDTPGGLNNVPLYTLGVEGDFTEYRVHVAFGNIICTQQKKRMGAAKMEEDGITPPADEVRNAIRTHANGWVFSINDITQLNDDAVAAVMAAMEACGAVTGCVDLLVTGGENAPVIIELNSAPALRSPTVTDAYVEAFRAAMPRPTVLRWRTSNGG